MITLQITGGTLAIIAPTKTDYITRNNGDFEIRNGIFFLQDKIFDKEYNLGNSANVVGFSGDAQLITYLSDFFSSNVVSLATMGSSVSVQNPIPTDGDAVYVKDIWLDQSITANWTDLDGTGEEIAYIPFNNLHTAIQRPAGDTSELLIHLERTVNASSIGLGCAAHPGLTFSNVKIELLGSGGVARTVFDDSANNTKYTSKDYQFEPQKFNAIRFTFNSADAITITNIIIFKLTGVEATLRLQKPNGEMVYQQATTGGNAKISLEEYESTFETSPLPVKPVLLDEFGIQSRLLGDTIFKGSPVVIDVEHHEIHCGDSWYGTRIADIAGTATDSIVINIPPKIGNVGYHAVILCETEGEAEFHVYEGASTVADGTPIPIFNRNRNSAETTLVEIFHTPTTATGGVDIFQKVWGSGKGVGGGARGLNERIQKDNTKYLITVTNRTAVNSWVSWEVNYYRHEDE